MKIVLGSSSLYRKSLLEKLFISFECCSPDIDESVDDGESPADLVKRLSIAKAVEVAKQYPNALIISSDQVAVNEHQILGKPGNHHNAINQLKSFSGGQVHFITGLCLYNSQTQATQYYQDDTLVTFRELSDMQITNYLIKDEPYNCAGSFRSEGLGAALFKSIKTTDPNALVGLPIIRLVEMLSNEGVDVLAC